MSFFYRFFALIKKDELKSDQSVYFFVLFARKLYFRKYTSDEKYVDFDIISFYC